MKPAAYFSSLSHQKIRCELCPHKCLLTPGKTGICLSRQNIDGVLITNNYLRPVSMALDPIEKKPLYHFFPGSSIFSTGPNGCTFKCSFCQNHEISQRPLKASRVTIADLLKKIQSTKSIGIAYTYSEPYIWFETIMELGEQVRLHGLKNVMVTNGFMEPSPLNDLLTVVDAMNIDIKSMDDTFYKRICKGRLQPVLRTCETAKKKCHLEITNLLIPGLNDSNAQVSTLARYIAQTLGRDTPLHLSRYFPRYTMATQSTPQKTLLDAWEICREHLDYVYVGNCSLLGASDTRCPSCGIVLVSRQNYSITCAKNLGDKNKRKQWAVCPGCSYETNIVLQAG